MSDKLRESLSALLDDEANELEVQRLLKYSTDSELRSTWHRYIQVRTVLDERRDQPAVPAADGLAFADGVMSAIAEGGVDGVTGPWRRVSRPLTGFAVAASVAVAVVVGGLQLPPAGEPAAPSVAANLSPVGLVNIPGATPVNASFGTQALPAHANSLKRQYTELARQQMQRYLTQHAEQAALNTPHGLVPFVRASDVK